jgi:hypothetical protein
LSEKGGENGKRKRSNRRNPRDVVYDEIVSRHVRGENENGFSNSVGALQHVGARRNDMVFRARDELNKFISYDLYIRKSI